MVTTTLKLRADLQSAEVVDAEGVLYYDVSDPKTGGVLRLFDYEWLIAQKLDGQRSLDELARWTEEQFGFATSRDDLQVYAERLQQLGLVDGAAAAGHKPLPAALYASAALKTMGLLPTQQGTTTPAAAQAPVQATTPTTASKPPQATAPRPLDKPVEPEPRRPSRDEDVMGQPFLAASRPAPLAHPQRPVATTPAPVTTPVQVAVVTPPVAAPVEPEPLSLPPLSRPKSDVLDAIESLPPPVEEALPPVASSTGPLQLVPPPVLQPEPVSPFNVTAAALLDQPPESKGPQIPIEQEPGIRPGDRTGELVKPVEPAPLPVAPTPAERPTVPMVDPAAPTVRAATVEPKPKAAVVETPKPVTPSAKTPATVQQSGGAGKWFVVFVVLALIAAALYYFLVMQKPLPPSSVGVSISIAKLEDVPRSFPTNAVVKKGEPQPLKIDADGTVAKVVAENTEVQPDTVLVQLDTQTKFSKELIDLRDRLSFYQKKLDSPKNKGKQDVLRDAQQKITEKQQRLEQVETLVKKSQLVAPRPGAVSKVMVKVGQAVTAGTEVVSLSDKALAAEIKIPAIEAQGMKVGQDAQFAGTGGPVTARVAALRTEGDYAMVQFLLPENATAKPGDELTLQRAALAQVVRMPAAALVDGSKVFVMRDGKAATLPVTVADRDGDVGAPAAAYPAGSRSSSNIRSSCTTASLSRSRLAATP